MFQKYKNKKLVAAKYMNGLDMSCFIPSIIKLMVENEFLFDIIVEKYKIEAINNGIDQKDYIQRHLKDIVRSVLIDSMTACGKFKYL